MRPVFRVIAVVALLAVATADTRAASVSRDAGYPVANSQVPSNTGTGFAVAKDWNDATSVSCLGELTYTSGAVLAGQAAAVDGLDDWRGTITGATDPNWKVRMICKMRATCSVVNHQTGSGSYTSSAYVHLYRECLGLPKADRFRQSSANKIISNEETFATGLAQFGTGSGVGEVNANFDLSGAQLKFKYTATANGSISTSRPEVTVKSEAYMEAVMWVQINAYDGTTLIDTLYEG